MKTSMQHWWNDADGGKEKCLQKIVFQREFVNHRYKMDGPTVKPGSPQFKLYDHCELYLESVPRSKHTPSLL